jgi:hypothetical protein
MLGAIGWNDAAPRSITRKDVKATNGNIILNAMYSMEKNKEQSRSIEYIGYTCE